MARADYFPLAPLSNSCCKGVYGLVVVYRWAGFPSDDRRQWWRCCLGLLDEGRRHDDVSPAGWLPPKAPTQNPRNQERRQPDADHVNVESIVPDKVDQPEEHRVEQHDRMLIHSASFFQALTTRATGSRLLAASANLARCFSYSPSGGSSTFAFRAYARWTALLLCPRASCANRPG